MDTSCCWVLASMVAALDSVRWTALPPYFLAVVPDAESLDGELEFLIGDTPTPVPKRYRLPCAAVAEVAVEQDLLRGFERIFALSGK